MIGKTGPAQSEVQRFSCNAQYCGLLSHAFSARIRATDRRAGFKRRDSARPLGIVGGIVSGLFGLAEH
jgi:hypothetical protein